jgi:hypothetical protein
LRSISGKGLRAVLNCLRSLIELFDSKSRGSSVAGHESGTLLGRDDIIDIVECTTAAFINDVE